MSAQMDSLEVEEADDSIVVRCSTPLGLCEDNVAAELFRVAERLGRRALSLDLGRVVFLTGHALGLLVSLHKKVRTGGGRLILHNVSRTVYEVFEITRLHALMDITPQSAPGQPLRVLIVDDYADAADSLQLLLDLWGHETRIARDGRAALEAVDAFRPHVVLLDIQMPRMNGGEVAVQLRRQPEQASIILVATTANESDDPRLAPYNGLFNHFLRKPYNLEELEDLLAACVARLPLNPPISMEP
jgi:anti-anti-sigma factor